MAKSNFIKEVASGKIDTYTSLKRLKLLLIDLKKDDILFWINSELSGYNSSDIPQYRKTFGNVFGSYTIDLYTSIVHYQNSPIPLGQLRVEDKDMIEKIEFREGISIIKDMIGKKIEKILVPELYPLIIKNTNISSIIKANVIVPDFFAANIVNIVENKVLDILVLLEEEFGNIDDLDIDYHKKSDNELDFLSNRIINIINVEDNSIKIGNNNELSDSHIVN